jgi:hypothetical protein
MHKHMHTHTHTQNNQPIPWNRVILEQMTVTKLVKEFPAFYGILKVHVHVNDSLQLLFITRLVYPAHTLPPPPPRFLKLVLTLYTIFICSMYATCPDHLILLLNFIILLTVLILWYISFVSI